MPYDELEQEINRFLEQETNLGGMSHLSTSHMEDVATEELTGTESVLTLDPKNRTGRMKQDFVRTLRDKYDRWVGTAQRLERRAVDMKESRSSGAAQMEFDNLISERDSAVKAIKDKHHQGRLGQLSASREETKALFDSMRKANNGKPPRRLPIWYFGVLFAIGASEWLINYDTFEFKFAVTAMAIGMTLLVAFSFAAASHFHGEALKQRGAQFGKHVDLSLKTTHRLFFIVSSVLFLVCFVAVVMVRYQVIQDQFSMSPNMGGPTLPGQSTGPQQSVMQLLFPTVLMNLAVYLLGLVISYAVHDPIPGYQAAERDANKARLAHEKEKKKQEAEIQQKESAFAADVNTKRSEMEQNTHEAKELEKLIKRLQEGRQSFRKACEMAANNYIEQYRTVLGAVAHRKGYSGLKFGARKLSLEDYLEADISVKQGEFDDA